MEIIKFGKIVNNTFFLPVLLRYSWYTALYKFVCSVVTLLNAHHEMITSSANIHHLI